MSDFKNLIAYKKAFSLAMDIFEITKLFPKEEKYSLVDQIRRSSRSVCACIGEAYRKRQYKAHFVAKISDADMENSETQVWLDFAISCGYLNKETHSELINKSHEIGRLLNSMIQKPEKYLGNIKTK